MASTTVYLITGSTRGIGFGLVAYILATHERAFVYAGARTPEKAVSLLELQKKYPERICIVKCVSADAEGNAAMAKEIEERHGRLDTVISNAGICKFIGSVRTVDISDFDEHLKVNVTATIILFQAVHDLLKRSADPRFVAVSSLAGSVGGYFLGTGVENLSYGASKAALNWVARKIHFENDWLTAFPLSPGGIDTDLVQNNFVQDPTGIFEKVVDGNMILVEEAAPILVKLIDQSTREKEGGQFVHIDGTRIEW